MAEQSLFNLAQFLNGRNPQQFQSLFGLDQPMGELPVLKNELPQFDEEQWKVIDNAYRIGSLVNPQAWEAMLEAAPMSSNIEDRRQENQPSAQPLPMAQSFYGYTPRDFWRQSRGLTGAPVFSFDWPGAD